MPQLHPDDRTPAATAVDKLLTRLGFRLWSPQKKHGTGPCAQLMRLGFRLWPPQKERGKDGRALQYTLYPKNRLRPYNVRLTVTLSLGGAWVLSDQQNQGRNVLGQNVLGQGEADETEKLKNLVNNWLIGKQG